MSLFTDFIQGPPQYPDVFEKTSSRMQPFRLVTAVSSSIPSGFGVTELGNGDIQITIANGTAASTNVGNVATLFFEMRDAFDGALINNVAGSGAQSFQLIGFEVISASSTNSGIEITSGWSTPTTGGTWNGGGGGVFYDPSMLAPGPKTLAWRWINSTSNFIRQALSAVPSGAAPIGWLNIIGNGFGNGDGWPFGAHIVDAFNSKSPGGRFIFNGTNSGINFSNNLGGFQWNMIMVRPNSLVSGDQTYVIRPFAFNINFPF